MKKSFTSDQKTTLVLNAFSEKFTIAELSSQFGVHATQISSWKNQAKQILKDGFSDKRKKDSSDTEKRISDLYQLIGKRDAELEWLKKKSSSFIT